MNPFPSGRWTETPHVDLRQFIVEPTSPAPARKNCDSDAPLGVTALEQGRESICRHSWMRDPDYSGPPCKQPFRCVHCGKVME